MERNYIIAGPEFGQLEGHYLIIVKALYGLRTSGDNFRMNTRYGRYGAAYNMIGLMKNFRCCQRIQQRQSYKLRVHGVNPQSPLKV
jgi:hypothetical protein